MRDREHWGPTYTYSVKPLDREVIKAEMEAAGYRWDFIEASIDYLSRPDEIAKGMGNFIGLDPNDEERLMSAIEQRVESHTKDYTAGGNAEPIRVYSYLDYRITQFVAKKIREALSFHL